MDSTTHQVSTNFTLPTNKYRRKLVVDDFLRDSSIWMNTSGPRIHIDLDEYQPKRICQQKYWIKDLGLLEEDRRILLDPYEELTDTIIDASQQLLKKCFPHVTGFQSVCCGLTMNFTVECGEFVQVLHNGRKHWLTISTIGTRHPIVHVYDSMYASASTTIKAQVAALLHSTFPSIQLNFMSVQMQSPWWNRLWCLCCCFCYISCFRKTPRSIPF